MNEMIQLEALSPEALGEVIRARADEFDKATMRAVEHAWHAGRALLAAKKLIPHGQWGHWLANNFEGRSHDTARIWMRLAANYESVRNLEDVKHGIRLLDEAPEKQARKAEREARKAEAPPKPFAPATPAPQLQGPVVETITEASTYHSVAAQVAKPAWLADPDELDRPEEDDLPSLPKTNTHHTTANRREPDTRETDRAGIVPPQDPRELQDGKLYIWRESANRLFLATPDEIWEAYLEVIPDKLAANSGASIPEPCDTKKVAESSRDTKPGKVPTLTALRSFVEERADIGTNRHLWSEAMVKGVKEWAAYKQSLTGKAKIRSLEQWAKALTRIENVVAAQGWPAVADMLEKAIANGWQGWEHQTDNGRKSGPVAPHRTYTRLNKPEIKYDELPE